MMKIAFRLCVLLVAASPHGDAVSAAAPPLSSSPSATSTSTPTPTYHQDVAPILREHCVECHRPGQVAPFSLLSFEQTKKRADLIATVTQSKRMPPWHASTIEGGPFRDARVLPPSAIDVLADWAEAGCPEGDASQALPPPEFESDWPLGKPDLVLTVAEPYKLGAEGRDEFRVFVLPTGLTEGKWVTAVDFRPGNRRIVHHILGAFDQTGRARELDKADPESGYHVVAGYGVTKLGLPFFPSGGLSGWAPGKRPSPLPSETGRYLPAGSDVLLQVHYHRSGKPESDATSVALYFAKEPIRRQIVAGMVMPPRGGRGLVARPELRIPAGAANHEVRGSLTLRDDFHANAVIPHMHWLGKDFLMTATKPDGGKITLIKIDRWDFNWQDTYDLVKPIPLPKGTKIEMVAHFDNSAENPANPSQPPVVVTWGEQTTNEMCIGFLQLTLDRENLLGAKMPPPRIFPAIEWNSAPRAPTPAKDARR